MTREAQNYSSLMRQNRKVWRVCAGSFEKVAKSQESQNLAKTYTKVHIPVIYKIPSDGAF